MRGECLIIASFNYVNVSVFKGQNSAASHQFPSYKYLEAQSDVLVDSSSLGWGLCSSVTAARDMAGLCHRPA